MICPLLRSLLLPVFNVVLLLHNRPFSFFLLSPPLSFPLKHLSLYLLTLPPLFTVLALLLARLADRMEPQAPHTFLYFAYGSNLLKERLQLKNPSAAIHCVARLMV